MDNNEHETHITTEDARAGSTPGITRYVLGISLFLVIVALTIVWVTGAFNADQSNNAQDNAIRAVAADHAKS